MAIHTSTLDTATTADAAQPALSIDGVTSENLGLPAFDVPYGGTANSAFPSVYGTGIPGTSVTLIDKQTGNVLDVVGVDANGHWEAKVGRSLSDGLHELYVSTFGQHSEPFPIHVDFNYTPPANSTETTALAEPNHAADPAAHIDTGNSHGGPSLEDVLSHRGAALFGEEAKPHAASADTATLDVSHLAQTLSGGVHAAAFDSSHLLTALHEAATHHA